MLFSVVKTFRGLLFGLTLPPLLYKVIRFRNETFFYDEVSNLLEVVLVSFGPGRIYCKK